MKRFFRDLKKYWPYLIYAAKSDLKSEVANSRLNWLWWILDPLLFMLVYTFIGLVVFQKSVEYFPVFVFTGLTLWYFFLKTVNVSVTMVRNNKSIVTKTYLPKHIFVLQRMLVNQFKMLVAFVLVAIMMVIWQVPLSARILQLLPAIVVLWVVTFGVSTILMHFGVFLNDLSNVVTVVLRLMLYLSGIFYSIADRVPEPYNMIMLKVNPVALCIDTARGALLYQAELDYMMLGIWFVAGIALSVIGIKLIYKYENSYAKVI